MIPRYMLSTKRWLPVLVLALILSGCGQKGALYLPDTEPAEAAARAV